MAIRLPLRIALSHQSAPRRVRIDGEQRAVVAVLIGPGRWIELRSVPAEAEAPKWLILLLPGALLGPLAIMALRWAERTPVRSRRETVMAWGFLAPAALHLLMFTVGPAIYAIYLASLAKFRALVRDPLKGHVAQGAVEMWKTELFANCGFSLARGLVPRWTRP